MPRLSRRAALLLPLATPGLAAPALAQGVFPSRPLRMVIPFPPGGGSDVLGRLLAQRIGEALGQTVVPENRSGAGGNIGTDAVAKAAPDGYTLVTVFNTIVVNQFVFRTMPFDLKRDLAPVAKVALAPTVIAAGPKLRERTLAEVIATTRREPGRLNHGTPGLGTITHVSAELMDRMSGGRLTHVHYRDTRRCLVLRRAQRSPPKTRLTVDPLRVIPHQRAGATADLSTPPKPVASHAAETFAPCIRRVGASPTSYGSTSSQSRRWPHPARARLSIASHG